MDTPAEAPVKIVSEIADGRYSVVEAPSLYVTIADAAHIVGVARATMEQWANDRRNPVPHISVGSGTARTRKKLVRVSSLAKHAEQMEAIA